MAKDHPTGKSGLYAAFLELETPEECYRFLQDVCSYAELSAMEQRYNIVPLDAVMVNAAGQALLRDGMVKGKKIYSLTADYLFGHDLAKAAKK